MKDYHQLKFNPLNKYRNYNNANKLDLKNIFNLLLVPNSPPKLFKELHCRTIPLLNIIWK